MMDRFFMGAFGLAVWTLTSAAGVPCFAEEAIANEEAVAKKATHDLRHKYAKGDVLRTKVLHRVAIKTTVKGTTQTAKTLSVSQKVWRITDVDPQGKITLVQSVESVDMRQQISDQAEARYNSDTDRTPPDGFRDVAKSIGVPLVRVTVSPRGEILDRTELHPQPNAHKGQFVTFLPEGPVPVGHVWTLPEVVRVKLKSGTTKQIKTRRRYELEKVEKGVAVIDVETQILTPIHDPEIEVQVIQHNSTGKIHFDIARGRLVKNEMELNKRVVDFAGPGSFMQYVARFSEEAQSPTQPLATKPAAKPADGPREESPPRIKR